MQIDVFTSNSMRAIFAELGPQFERETGHKIAVSYDPGKIMLRRIDAGESADVALLNDTAIDDLIAQGKILADSRRSLVRLGVGVGVRAGAARPRIDTVAAFKQMLLDAPSIAHTSEGASGMHFSVLIEQLGVAAEVKAKARTQPGGLVGELVTAGVAAIAIQQIPELLAVPGIDLVGPLPAELQKTSVTVGGVFTSSRRLAPARGLIDFLLTPAARKLFEARGFELEPAGKPHQPGPIR